MIREAEAEEEGEDEEVAEGEGEARGGDVPGGERARGSSGLSAEDLEERWITVRLKTRSTQDKAFMKTLPAQGGYGLFGWHTVPEDATAVVLTEGEFDAMAVHQATGMPAVSLPSGINNLPEMVIPLLERFERIFLWTDFDQPGRDGAERISKKLGLDRCVVVRELPDTPKSVKDANDALRQGVDLKELLAKADFVRHRDVATVPDYMSQVVSALLDPDAFKGAEVKSLPRFSKLLKGFRKGELTVFTGPTGAGKTTLLTQISLDLAGDNHKVLWGSFEMRNEVLIRKMLQIYTGSTLAQLQDTRRENLEKSIADLASRPLYFLTYHGATDMKRILDALDYTVKVENVEHIIIDNL
eukprot:scaffold8310_cov325-Pinguiococcus_pyrenoidosus.AAC.1